MHIAVDCVRAFHKKMGFDDTQPLDGTLCKSLIRLGAQLQEMSESIKLTSDRRTTRAHLMLEELGELLRAMGRGDEVETLDALADLTYVVMGSAITMDLPLPEAFSEVHRSNMTKVPEQDRPGHPGKQEGYQPPDLEKLIALHRKTGGMMRRRTA